MIGVEKDKYDIELNWQLDLVKKKFMDIAEKNKRNYETSVNLLVC